MTKYLSLLLSSLLSSCSADIQNSVIQHKVQKKISAFTFLRKSITIENDVIKVSANLSTASGSCIRHKNVKEYRAILTVAHFCNIDIKNENNVLTALQNLIQLRAPNQNNVTITQNINAIMYSGAAANARIVNVDAASDLCLLELDDARCDNTIYVSQEFPPRNILVYNYAAPMSLFEPYNVLIFSGFFSGLDVDKDMTFTIPATYGSSGSPILNNKLQLISIIKLTYSDFNQVSYGVNILRINKFLSNN